MRRFLRSADFIIKLRVVAANSDQCYVTQTSNILHTPIFSLVFNKLKIYDITFLSCHVLLNFEKEIGKCHVFYMFSQQYGMFESYIAVILAFRVIQSLSKLQIT